MSDNNMVMELNSYSSGQEGLPNGGEIPQYRDPSQAPLRKLTVDLIKTYRHINEVCIMYIYAALMRCLEPWSNMYTFYDLKFSPQNQVKPAVVL